MPKPPAASWEPHVIAIFSHIKKGWTVVDIGAEKGFYTFFASLKMGNEGNVISVEPHPEYFRRLQIIRTSFNLSNIRLVNAAVTNKDGPVKFNLARGQTSVIPSMEEKRNIITVNGITLDKLLKDMQSVNLIKMDIEGGELYTLHNHACLERVQSIIVEIHYYVNSKEFKLILDILKRYFSVKCYRTPFKEPPYGAIFLYGVKERKSYFHEQKGKKGSKISTLLLT